MKKTILLMLFPVFFTAQTTMKKDQIGCSDKRLLWCIYAYGN